MVTKIELRSCEVGTVVMAEPPLPYVEHLANATICFPGHCHPTPLGSFPPMHANVGEPRYGGDVLAFAHDESGVHAIHRLLRLDRQLTIPHDAPPKLQHDIAVAQS